MFYNEQLVDTVVTTGYLPDGESVMKHYWLLLVAAGLSFGVHADSEKGQSIMFGDPDPIYTEKTVDTTADDHAAFCKKLRKQMESLEGNPLRRNSVEKRYQIECVGQSDRIYQSE